MNLKLDFYVGCTPNAELTKNMYICTSEIFHDQKDTYIYFGIGSLHKMFIPRFNTK
jgi:hypothetical protein